MILLIDNYDSFSYNLFQMVGEINPDIKVIRNDEMSVDDIKALSPEKIIISPGPGRPAAATIADVVEILKLPALSPPVPTISKRSKSVSTGVACFLIALAQPAISPVVSALALFVDSAARNAAF